MKLFFRLVCILAGAGVILAAVVIWLVNDPDMGPGSVEREFERSRELDRELYRSQERFLVLEDLVAELVAGRTSLSEAVDQSRVVHRDDGVILQHIRRAFGGSSNDEALCRHLLFRVASSLRHSPRTFREVLPRLKTEFKQLYPLTKQPVVDRSPLSMEPSREGYTGSSSYDPVDPGL